LFSMPRRPPTPPLFPSTTLFRSMFRLLFFLPYVLADVAAGMIWRFVYDGQFGLVAGIFNAMGMSAPFWLADRQVAFYAVLGVIRSEEHTSELQSRENLVCRLLLE